MSIYFVTHQLSMENDIETQGPFDSNYICVYLINYLTDEGKHKFSKEIEFTEENDTFPPNFSIDDLQPYIKSNTTIYQAKTFISIFKN
jgi:hypothetical protein